MKSLTACFALVAALTPIAISGAQDATWETYTAQSKAFSIKVPKGWTPYDSDNPEFREFLKDLEKENPNMANGFKSASSERFDVFLMDVSDESVEDGFADNLNVLVNPIGRALTNKELEQARKEIIAAMPAEKPFVGSIIPFAGKKGVRYTGTMVTNLPGGEKSRVDIFGTIVEVKGKIYTFTLSCGPGQLPDKKALFGKIMGTVKFK